MSKPLFVLSCLLSSCFAVYPAQLLDLSQWKLQLPVGPQDHPEEIEQPRLNTFVLEPYFYAEDGHVVFAAWVNGSHTGGSHYPRTELSQSGVLWSNTDGSHSMTVEETVVHLPDKRPEVVTAQILSQHGPKMQIRLNNNSLLIQHATREILQADYVLGTRYRIDIVAEQSRIRVYYNNVLKASWEETCTDCYFKAGCYTQSNLSFDPPSAYGQTIIYSLTTKHTS
eukprot:TRINITY_DN12936_c0_g1_i1.p1 TRINITY_DN12936_c0_g1~~TRINITY_DN12936_c0_g1_i1.p1  ORF type:complete len:225 (+),score=28.23 TRINITY_DN12936_c0_g1_i1:115-789(+)